MLMMSEITQIRLVRDHPTIAKTNIAMPTVSTHEPTFVSACVIPYCVVITDPLIKSSPINFPDSLKKVLHCLNIPGTGSNTIGLPVTPISNKYLRELKNSKLAYRMSSPIKGRCLIINNREFDTLEARIGSEKDVENIQRVFGELSFVCEVMQNLTTKRMKQAIKEETKREEHHQYGMFVLIIMSHGANGIVTGTDGSHLVLAEVYKLLTPAEFPAMDGKPKLVIVQACAGQCKDTDVFETDSAEPHSRAPDDLFIAKAAFDGYVSIRSKEKGSLFIRALLVALCKYSCILDFETLLTGLVLPALQWRTQQLWKGNSNPHGAQTSTSQDQLKKKLYLCPRPDQAM